MHFLIGLAIVLGIIYGMIVSPWFRVAGLIVIGAAAMLLWMAVGDPFGWKQAAYEAFPRAWGCPSAWTIPASRMKSGREHRVPLSDAALAVLARVGRREGLKWVAAVSRCGRVPVGFRLGSGRPPAFTASCSHPDDIP
jgi:hypothetical protein